MDSTHLLYLKVPMMTSFVAAREDDIALRASSVGGELVLTGANACCPLRSRAGSSASWMVASPPNRVAGQDTLQKPIPPRALRAPGAFLFLPYSPNH